MFSDSRQTSTSVLLYLRVAEAVITLAQEQLSCWEDFGDGLHPWMPREVVAVVVHPLSLLFGKS